MSIFLASVLLLASSGQQSLEEVDPFQLNHRPVEWIGKRLRVCGKPFQQPDGQLQVFAVWKGESKAVDLDGAIVAIRVGASTCYDGVFRRRDGLTAEDIRRRGYVEGIADVASNPYYFLSAD